MHARNSEPRVEYGTAVDLSLLHSLVDLRESGQGMHFDRHLRVSLSHCGQTSTSPRATKSMASSVSFRLPMREPLMVRHLNTIVNTSACQLCLLLRSQTLMRESLGRATRTTVPRARVYLTASAIAFSEVATFTMPWTPPSVACNENSQSFFFLRGTGGVTSIRVFLVIPSRRRPPKWWKGR